MLSKYETWLQTAQSNESITYHEGYLARDRFFNNTTELFSAHLIKRFAISLVILL